MTNVKTKLEKSNYPKLVTDLAYQNHFLKKLVYGLILAMILTALLLVYELKKAPEVIALDPSGTIASVSSELHTSHVESAVKKYLEYRYSWNPKDVDQKLKKAEDFVLPQLATSFRRSLLETIKFVKDRNVTQRVYPQKIEVDLKKKTVQVLADRFTEFDALKAATVLKLVLNFDVDSPSNTNPWGIYLTKETEVGGDK